MASTDRRTWRDLALGAAALLAFPLVMSVPAWNADGEGRSVDDPLWHRGGEAPVETAGR